MPARSKLTEAGRCHLLPLEIPANPVTQKHKHYTKSASTVASRFSNKTLEYLSAMVHTRETKERKNCSCHLQAKLEMFIFLMIAENAWTML